MEVFFGAVTSAHAQVPRGENSETLAQDAESPLGFLLIFAAIAVFSAFKRNKQEGVKVLGFCIALALLVWLLPQVGMLVIGVLGLMIAWGMFRSFL
jgi:Na+/glutamate symporter